MDRSSINRLISDYNHYTYSGGRDIQGIVIHYVGAVSTAYNNAVYFSGGNRNASAHYFVDRNEIWQSVEDWNAAWHCGGGAYSQGSGGSSWGYVLKNSNTLGIEMCCESGYGLGEVVPWETVHKTGELVRMLREEYGIPADHVVRHFDITGKDCPAWIEMPEYQAASGLDDSVWYRVWSELNQCSCDGGTAPACTETECVSTAADRGGELEVDGYWGRLTSKRLQEVLGCVADGEVWHQWESTCSHERLTGGWCYDTTGSGSPVIKALQTRIGAEADGLFGPDSRKAFCSYYGASTMAAAIMQMQANLNGGTI